MRTQLARWASFFRALFEYRGMEPQDAFDRIYERNVWTDAESRSGAGSSGPWLKSSVDYVLEEVGLRTRSVLEIGCGDFAFGRHLAPHAHSYAACDVSGKVIEHCQENYANVKVRFFRADAAVDPLPVADVVLIRQVLQHLPNKVIAAILGRDELASADVVIFEHVPAKRFIPNRDLPGPGPYTRVNFSSGVDPASAPFRMPYELAALFEAPPELSGRLAVYRSERSP